MDRYTLTLHIDGGLNHPTLIHRNTSAKVCYKNKEQRERGGGEGGREGWDINIFILYLVPSEASSDTGVPPVAPVNGVNVSAPPPSTTMSADNNNVQGTPGAKRSSRSNTKREESKCIEGERGEGEREGEREGGREGEREGGREGEGVIFLYIRYCFKGSCNGVTD